MAQEFAQVPLGTLTVGSVLTSPLFEAGSRQRKLLGKNVEIDQSLLQKLQSRGVTSVAVSKKDLATIAAGQPQCNRKSASDPQYRPCRLETEHTRQLEAELAEQPNVAPESKPLDARWNQPPESRYEPGELRELTAEREKQVAYVDSLFVDLVKNDGFDDFELGQVCSHSIRSVLNDKDLFMRLGLNPYESDYPSRHSLHVSSVAISIGVMLGLDDQDLLDLGTGCLIHDVGMLKLDRSLYKAKRVLTAKERDTLVTHPILTLEALACPGVRLSRVARIVAYQIHERCNGSGYPRGISGEQMHYLSKIAAVADAYVGLVSNRAHRRALMPYYAVEKILRSIPAGLFDAKVVRGLLHAVSLYPIGSCVELSTGQIARVVRACGESYMRPIVEIWNNKFRQYEPDLVNLAKEPSLNVRRAIPNV